MSEEESTEAEKGHVCKSFISSRSRVDFLVISEKRTAYFLKRQKVIYLRSSVYYFTYFTTSFVKMYKCLGLELICDNLKI